ncbi:MAG: acyl-[acyl-carrier-protein]--UDP-N-acetylglucosamine O-acyltransferase, partial [Moorea sp. SIO3I7]|nr:acyl-[acyl-carrier-protein]--UDP-N-acetylglucosamine O-acyltransferase [Moorena sp. SIO3I7]
VPPYMLVEGNPSRVRSLNLIGLKRAGLTTGEIRQLKNVFRKLYLSGQPFTKALQNLELPPDNPHVEHLHQFLQLSVMEGRRGLIPGRR